MRHLLEGGFSPITALWDTLIQILSYPKMCRKNFENRFTKKNIMTKNVFE